MRALYLTVLVLGLVIAGTVTVLRDRVARTGQIYAFDADNGTEVWHHPFSGVDPSLIVDGSTISVVATVGSGCASGHDVVSRFDAKTGRRLPAPTRIHTTAHREIKIDVKGGVVTVRGHLWKAPVLNREPSRAVAAGHLVFVAVTGLWGGKLCND